MEHAPDRFRGGVQTNNTDIMMNSVTLVAQKDMISYLGTHGNNFDDIWDVCTSHVFSKESKKLNRALGIHKVNK